MDTINLEAKKREMIGKKVKQLRAQGLIPAVLYGKKIDSQNLLVAKNNFEKAFDKAGTSSLVDLKIEKDNPIKVLIHEPQCQKVSGEIIHADFYKVRMSEKITTEIPLKFVGESAAVADLDGNLITSKDALEVECLPSDLVSEIEVDISKLKTFDDIISVKDLNIPKGMELMAEGDEIIASVTPPRSEEELEAELAEDMAEEEKEKIEEIEAEAEKEKTGEEKEGEEETKSETKEETKEKEGENKK